MHRLIDPVEVPTPETREMSFNDFHSYVDAPTYRSLPVRTALLEGVLFCPNNNVIMTPERTVIQESAGPGANTFHVDEDATVLHTDVVEPVSGISTALRCSFDNYYHFLVDNLSRFDLLNQEYFSQYEQINLLCPGGLRPTEEYFVSKLCPPNVSILNLEPDALYRPEKYIFLSFPTRRSSGYVPGPFVSRLREQVSHGEVASRTRRLYISRRKASHRRVRNEEALMRSLQGRGFRRYDLEDLGPQKQIQLFREAELVVAPHGAGLANLLFATGITVVELQASRNVAPHFYLLCKRLNHDYRFITHDAPDVDSSFITDPDEVIRHLPPL
jgi:capsular polysaccharide biosynthesis protein